MTSEREPSSLPLRIPAAPVYMVSTSKVSSAPSWHEVIYPCGSNGQAEWLRDALKIREPQATHVVLMRRPPPAWRTTREIRTPPAAPPVAPDAQANQGVQSPAGHEVDGYDAIGWLLAFVLGQFLLWNFSEYTVWIAVLFGILWILPALAIGLALRVVARAFRVIGRALRS